MIIYKAINKTNGKIYIGKTKSDLKSRLVGYDNEIKYRKTVRYFIHALKKYSKEGFEWDEIDQADHIEELNYLEKYWIKFYQSNNPKYGYNLTEGGDGGTTYVIINGEKVLSSDVEKEKLRSGERIHPHLGKKRSEESKRKHSESRKGKYCGEESWRLGVKHTQEAKDKISNANTGVQRSQEIKDYFSEIFTGDGNPFFGQIHSEETKIKISKANKGRKRTKEQKEKTKLIMTRLRGRPIICLETGEKFESIAEAARTFGFDSSSIRRVCIGKNKTCNKFHFQFLTKE